MATKPTSHTSKVTSTNNKTTSSTEKEQVDSFDDVEKRKLIERAASMFWQNTKEFVEAINGTENKPSKSWIQFQTYRTYYYGVLFSAASYRNEKSGSVWVGVKVGLTQLDDFMKRPKDICKQVISSFNDYESPEDRADISKQVRAIFCVPHDPLDPRRPFEVEKHVRLTVGLQLSVHIAKELRLPVPTEWVTANIGHLRAIQAEWSISGATSKNFTANNEYKGILPKDFKLEITSQLVPESEVPTMTELSEKI